MQIEVEKKDQRYSFEANKGEKILYAGLRAGIPLPYECATGTCGTCRARVKQGEIQSGWIEAPGAKNLKTEKQEFLMCQATAEEACTVGVPARIKAFRGDDIAPNHQFGVINNLIRRTHDVLSFSVELEEAITFHPGQFFVVKAPDIDGYRAYSMVNYQPKVGSLEFVIKQLPEGGFSNWIFKTSREGEKVELFGPLGQATFHRDESHDLLMVAGGSGIAGLMSILQSAADANYFSTHKAQLFFGVRTWEDAFYVDRLTEMKHQYRDNLEITIVVSDETDKRLPPESLELFSHGYGWVHEVALAAASGQGGDELNNTMFYIAGPKPMVDGCIRALILDAKISPAMIRYDKFS